MAVGFVCRDGVVIGADRQVTGQNYTFPECKLISFRWANGHGILAYSGNRDTFINFSSELGSRLPDTAEMRGQSMKTLLKDCIEATLQKKEQFLTLMGFWIDGESPCMVMSTPQKRIVEVADCEVIGIADSPLSRSLLGRIRDTAVIRISVHQARIYAVDFVSQAKKYDGQFVGDGIDVYAVTRGNRIPGALDTLVVDAAQTPAWEEQIRIMHHWQDVLFYRLTEKQVPVSMDQFMERLRDFRAWAAPNEEERWHPRISPSPEWKIEKKEGEKNPG